MRSKFIGVCVLLLVLTASVSLGANWYIAPSGSDANGCTQNQPCQTAARGISRMNDGDTLWVADGRYTQGLVSGQNCASGNTMLYIGADKSCPTQGCAVRAQNVTHPPSVTFEGGSAGVVVNRVQGWTVEGIETIAVTGLAQCDSSHTVFRDMRVAATGTRTINLIIDSSDIVLERFETFRHGKSCEISPAGSGFAFAIKDVNDMTITESYLGYTFHLMTLVRVNGLTLKRSQLQHWGQHGIVFGRGTRNVLLENNIIGGTSRAGCSTSPMYGPRLIDMYEGRNVTVRNNTVVGHGYSPRSALISYYFFGNTYAGCELSAEEPGFCEFDTDVSCTVNDNPSVPGVSYSETSSQCPTRPGTLGWSPNQRCSGVCELDNVKLYNNLIYDLRDTGEPEAGTRYINWLSQGVWSTTTNLTLDGNYYSGGVEKWICTGSDGERGTLADWRTAQCLGGAGPPDPHSIMGTCSGAPATSCGADGDCPGAQTCVPRPPAFVNYSGENYRAPAGAPQIDAGVVGVDAEGVARCAAEDFRGALRQDGACDIGAFEFGADTDSGGSEIPNGEVPGQVPTPRRSDQRD